MRPHVAARLHAFIHGLFRTKDEVETAELFEEVSSLFERHGVHNSGGRTALINKLAINAADGFGIAPGHPRFAAIDRLAVRLFDYEQLFLLPEIDWSEKRSTAKCWELRDALFIQKRYAADFETTADLVGCALYAILEPIFDAMPQLKKRDAANDDLIVKTPLLHGLGDARPILHEMMARAFAKDLKEHGLFSRFQDQLERNLIATSGGDPRDPKSFTRQAVSPEKSQIKDPTILAETYLAATPLIDFLDQEIDFAIPTATRFEHMHIVAGSGHGKSQTLQYLICQDLEAVARGERSIIVLDSQGDLIRNIAHLAEFAPGGPLHDKIVLIDPTDVEWPVSLNLFDVGRERLESYEALERERLTNSILELYDFVLGSLLDAGMTQKQNVIFRYVTRLMLHIPDATIHTLRELMEPDSHIAFAPHIEKLTGTAKRFFETEFKDKEFASTKKQVLRRLWGILENQTFERMFSHPRSKLDLFAEMNAGKVILINTAKDLLKEQGSEIFGRFFIALIAQAAQERATLKEKDRKPTFVYIDEAADYFDRNIGIILAQARKYKVGMVLAHQYLGQLEPKLQDAFAANTSIKLAGGVSNKDARALAPMLHAEPDLIEARKKGSFAAYVRGTTANAVPLQFPLGHLERKPRMDAQEWRQLRDEMRKRYAVHHSALGKSDDAEPEGEDGPGDGAAESDAPAKPTKETKPKATSSPPKDDFDIEPSSEW